MDYLLIMLSSEIKTKQTFLYHFGKQRGKKIPKLPPSSQQNDAEVEDDLPMTMPPMAPAFWMLRAFSANMHCPLCSKAIFPITASGLVSSEQPLYGLLLATNPLVCQK